MLDPHKRMLLIESLKPPVGYRLDQAVGTTFTMDLLALLTCPLSFALFDYQEVDGRPALDPHALLEALRRYSDRMSVFCQAGYIGVPKPDQPLYTYLEGSVFECRARIPGHIFHPKFWVLRFSSDDQPILYRVIIQSRNLTFDRSWDTAVVLEGELRDRERAIRANKPLAEMVEALPALAIRRLGRERGRAIRQMGDELRRVAFELPEGFDRYLFWPLGLKGQTSWPFDEEVRRMMVISPFLQADVLKRLTQHGGDHVLVSRIESMEKLPAGVPELFKELLVLSDAADMAAEGSEGEEIDPDRSSGLHAKVFVADDGWNAHVWTGSANATNAAFAGNVELLVQLTGKKSACGVDAFLSSDARSPGMRDLLSEFVAPGEPDLDEQQEQLDRRLDAARIAIATAYLRARATADDDGFYTLELLAEKRFDPPSNVTLRAWPIRIGEAHSRPIGPGTGPLASFAALTPESLTSFFAFEVATSLAGKRGEARFSVNLPLEGAPANRRDLLVAALLDDEDKLLKFLLILLSDLEEGAAGDSFAALAGSLDDPRGPVAGGMPLFESLMRALARDPERLDNVAEVLRSLREANGDAHCLPAGFAQIWEPIWAAHRGQQ